MKTKNIKYNRRMLVKRMMIASCINLFLFLLTCWLRWDLLWVSNVPVSLEMRGWMAFFACVVWGATLISYLIDRKSTT